jgi:hypothetical protein
VVVVESRTTPGEDEWQEDQRFLALDLMAGHRNYGWGYKDMDESQGPVEVDCPLSLLAMVPCPTGGYAAGWREKVRAYHEAEKRRKSLKDGDIITFSEPIKFRNGMEESEFIVDIIGNKVRLYARHGFYVRISTDCFHSRTYTINKGAYLKELEKQLAQRDQ